jgi:adenylate kinase family enzyme
MKLLIIGNAGCGKTYLAKKISKSKNIPIFHIDNIWFKPGGYGKEFERTSLERKEMIKNIMGKSKYIIEGASGITAKQFAPKVSHIIWVSYPKTVCINSIKTRKLPTGQKSTPQQTQFLVNMAKEYYNKNNKSSVSLTIHKDIFNNFKGSKYMLVSREDANNLKVF